jgi:ABC-type transport system, involved in lipoprotein release, permease component
VVNSTAARRLMLVLLSVFAGTALLLAALGLAGVMAYAVACRTREFGIRLALGATRAEILRLVLSRGAMLTGAGALIGLAGAFVPMRLLRAWLFETEPSDPLTFVAVTLILAAVSVGAAVIPARRAAKVDPMVALRAE